MRLVQLYIIAFIAITLSGLIFRVGFSFYHHDIFHELSSSDWFHAIFWGLRFDFAVAAILTFFPLLLLSLIARVYKPALRWNWLFLPGLTLQIVLSAADIMYFADAGRHLGYEIRDTMNDFGSIAAMGFDKYISIAIPSVAAIVIANGLLLKLLATPFQGYDLESNNSSNLLPTKFIQREVPLLILLLVSAVFVRGGITDLPLNPAFRFKLGDPLKADIALNGAYSGIYYMIRSKGKVDRLALPPVESAQLNQTIEALHPNPVTLNMDLTPTNVIVILLESWPAAYMQSYGYAEPVTPNFDKYFQQGIRTEGLIANGHRTTEGIFATFCSSQNPLDNTIAKSQLQSYSYGCLPQLLKEQGWSTAFFQGSNKETSGTGSFAQSLGFTESYGKADIKERKYEENDWGVFDPDLYGFVLKHIEQQKEPFLLGINTNTTHDDCLPEGIEDKFGLDTDEERRKSVLHFADDSLAEFIETVKATVKSPTLFVLLADHTAGTMSSRLTHFYLPFLIFSTEQDFPSKKINALASQRDIAPTILDLLNGSAPWFTGHSLLQEQTTYYADYFTGGTLGWIENEKLVEQHINSGKLTCYNWRDNFNLQQKRLCDAEDQLQAQRGLSFTSYSQNLIFSGKTQDYGLGIFR